MDQHKIILFGDSITQQCCNVAELGFGHGPALQNHYMRKLDVVVRGYSGYTSDAARYLIDPILVAEHTETSKVELCIVFFGSNDAARLPSKQHVDINRYEANIDWITQTLRSKDIDVILVAPALVDETQDPEDRNRFVDDFRDYGLRVKKIAEKHKVGFVDLWTIFAKSVATSPVLQEPLPGKQGGPSIKHLLPDSLHFSGTGHKLFYKAIVEEIHAKYPRLDPDNLPTTLPHWEQLDPNDMPDTLHLRGN